MKTWKNSPQKLLKIHKQHFFSLLVWLPKWPIIERNRNLIGSPCLLSTISLGWVLTAFDKIKKGIKILANPFANLAPSHWLQSRRKVWKSEERGDEFNMKGRFCHLEWKRANISAKTLDCPTCPRFQRTWTYLHNIVLILFLFENHLLVEYLL